MIGNGLLTTEKTSKIMLLYCPFVQSPMKL
jgi:hypothetical protein